MGCWTEARRGVRSGPTPAGPYRTVDNEFGVLDKSDLVMIDPVGTGLSHAVCDHRDENSGGSIGHRSVSRFIAQYVSDNNRWTSPKYLLGESYGTTRGAPSSTTCGDGARSPSTA